MMTSTEKLIYKLQVVAFLLSTAGWGWAAGNFTPSGAPFINPLLHTIPVVLLLIQGLLFFRAPGEGRPTRGAIVFISVMVLLNIVTVAVLIVLGATNPDPNAVGVKTLEDWFPTVIMLMGDFLWLATLIPARLARVQAA
ncbi:MAG TPA: hypothetical protein VGT44_17500 [Ktedonobacteraceae bacterium]|nr:hypothetical protein [Ktedonobacteraceae bacterium]